MKYFLVMFLAATPLLLLSQINVRPEEEGILFMEKGKEVMFYQITPRSLDGRYTRCNYFHPVWDLSGNIISEDFPADHLHHRGIFWAWHQIFMDGKSMGDLWALENIVQEVEDVEYKILPSGVARLQTEVIWSSTADGQEDSPLRLIRENLTLHIHPKKKNYRRLDFEIALQAFHKNVMMGGSNDEKGYSGFSVRMILPPDVRFDGPDGLVEPKVNQVESPGFINVTGTLPSVGKKVGVAILDHPQNPMYPQKWILRSQKSMQNAAFPGRDLVAVPDDQPLILRYSVLIHDANLKTNRIASESLK